MSKPPITAAQLRELSDKATPLCSEPARERIIRALELLERVEAVDPELIKVMAQGIFDGMVGGTNDPILLHYCEDLAFAQARSALDALRAILDGEA